MIIYDTPDWFDATINEFNQINNNISLNEGDTFKLNMEVTGFDQNKNDWVINSDYLKLTGNSYLNGRGTVDIEYLDNGNWLGIWETDGGTILTKVFQDVYSSVSNEQSFSFNSDQVGDVQINYAFLEPYNDNKFLLYYETTDYDSSGYQQDYYIKLIDQELGVTTDITPSVVSSGEDIFGNITQMVALPNEKIAYTYITNLDGGHFGNLIVVDEFQNLLFEPVTFGNRYTNYILDTVVYEDHLFIFDINKNIHKIDYLSGNIVETFDYSDVSTLDLSSNSRQTTLLPTGEIFVNWKERTTTENDLEILKFNLDQLDMPEMYTNYPLINNKYYSPNAYSSSLIENGDNSLFAFAYTSYSNNGMLVFKVLDKNLNTLHDEKFFELGIAPYAPIDMAISEENDIKLFQSVEDGARIETYLFDWKIPKNVYEISKNYIVTDLKPIDLNSLPNAIREDAELDTLIDITAFAFDNVNSENNVTYSISKDDGEFFKIDPYNGIVSLNKNLDYENK